ncbi:MAG: hypothetical protein ACI841_002129 [Planctomycetota bacterium]|jgi:hypothetical protein
MKNTLSIALRLFAYASLASTPAFAQSWATHSGLPTARHRLAATVAKNTGGVNCILAFGGTDGGLNTYDTVEMLNPISNIWSTRTSMPTQKSGMAAAVSNNGSGQRSYLAGGSLGGNGTTIFWEFDNIGNSWNTSLPQLPQPRTYASAATGPNGFVYVFGGYDDVFPYFQNSVFCFDPVAGIWNTDTSWSYSIPNMPNRRQKSVAATSCDGLIYVVGGGNSSDLLAMDVYDPTGNVWLTNNPITLTPWAPLPAPRYLEVTGAIGRDNRLYLIGGDGYPYETGVVDVYDPITNSWGSGTPEPTTRNGQAAVALGSRVFAVGGWKKFAGVQTATESYGGLAQNGACVGVVPTNPIGWHYCTAVASSVGLAAEIFPTGSDSEFYADLVMHAEPVPNQPGIVYYGPNQIEMPFGDGFRCVGGNVTRLPVAFAQNNILSVPVFRMNPDGTTSGPRAGQTVNFQAWFRDPQMPGGSGFNLSNGYTITFVP